MNRLFVGSILVCGLFLISYYPVNYYILHILLNVPLSHDILYLLERVPVANLWFEIIIFYSAISLERLVFFLTNPLTKSSAIHILTITATSDIWQYIIGKYFGRNLAIPAVSPHKTIEGYAGGIVITVFLLQWWIPAKFILKTTFLGIFGDLWISFLKRKLKIKNTGTCLGEHGGWIDRMDSSLLPVWFLI